MGFKSLKFLPRFNGTMKTKSCYLQLLLIAVAEYWWIIRYIKFKHKKILSVRINNVLTLKIIKSTQNLQIFSKIPMSCYYCLIWLNWPNFNGQVLHIATDHNESINCVGDYSGTYFLGQLVFRFFGFNWITLIMGWLEFIQTTITIWHIW